MTHTKRLWSNSTPEGGVPNFQSREIVYFRYIPKMVSKVIKKDTKVKRVESNIQSKRALTKPELVLQVKALQEANDALEDLTKEKELVVQQTQTDMDLELKCEECNFEGESDRELG